MTTIPFHIVTDTEFPDGLTCPECRRHMSPGQPYSEIFEEMLGDDVMTVLTCVYCPGEAIA